MENAATAAPITDTAHSITPDDPRVYDEDCVALSTAFGAATTQWVPIGGISAVYATVQSPNLSIRYF